MKDYLKVIIIILAILFFIAWYPFITSVENGETTCKNLFGITMKCR